MSAESTEVLRTFARLADTLVVGYEVVDLLQMLVDACEELLEVSAAGIMLTEPGGELSVVASSDESSQLVDLFYLDGPALESYRTSSIVAVADLAQLAEPFATAARELGFAAVHAVPLRLRDTTLGTLLLLRTETGDLSAEDATAAQAFADVATIGILHEKALRESHQVRDQLQNALNSRVVIEQAKGAIAFTHGITMPEAFAKLRGYARSHQLGIGQVAAQIIARELTLP